MLLLALDTAANAISAALAERVLADAATERLTRLYLRRPDAVEPSRRKPALATGET